MTVQLESIATCAYTTFEHDCIVHAVSLRPATSCWLPISASLGLALCWAQHYRLPEHSNQSYPPPSLTQSTMELAMVLQL